jgi:hypothetical protein
MLVAVFRMAEPDLLADSPRISPTLLPVFPTFSCERWEKCGRSPGHVWEHVERRVGEIVVSDETTGSGVAWVLPKNCLRIVWILPEDCSPTGNIQTISREYPENTQRILRQFPYNYQTLIPIPSIPYISSIPVQTISQFRPLRPFCLGFLQIADKLRIFHP